MGFWDKIERTIIADPDGVYFATKELKKIEKLLIKKDYYTVLERANKFIEEHPDAFNGYFYKGHALYFLKKYSDALTAFNKTIEYNHKMWSPYFFCGHIHIDFENYQIALSYFERALELKHDSANLLDSKGLCHLYLDEFDEANRSFAKAYGINKSDGLNNSILHCFVKNRFEENLVYIEQAKKLDYDSRGILILNYLEAMNSCMLGKSYSHNVEVVNKLSKKIKYFLWEFIWIDKWLKTEIIDEEKRKFIVEINNQLKELRNKLDKK
ncbi:MAG: hypothetical protein KBG21_09525 [Ignavibacteria bacterium]|nr:hypothetical protein [Ignavibacteria bacterium]